MAHHRRSHPHGGELLCPLGGGRQAVLLERPEDAVVEVSALLLIQPFGQQEVGHVAQFADGQEARYAATGEEAALGKLEVVGVTSEELDEGRPGVAVKYSAMPCTNGWSSSMPTLFVRHVFEKRSQSSGTKMSWRNAMKAETTRPRSSASSAIIVNRVHWFIESRQVNASPRNSTTSGSALSGSASRRATSIWMRGTATSG